MKVTGNLRTILAIMCVSPISFVLPTAISAAAISTSERSIDSYQSSGYIITAGGYNSSYGPMRKCYVLDLTSGVWSALPDLPYPSELLAMVANKGKVYAIGGIQDGAMSNNTNYLSTRNNSWLASTPVNNTFGTSTAVSLNNSIYVVGSLQYPFNLFKVQRRDGSWSTLPRTLQRHDGASAAVLNGNIYVCGGQQSNLCEFYNPKTHAWTALPPMAITRTMPAVVALQGYLYVIGGSDGFNERYDPTTGQWSFFPTTITNPLSWTVAVTDGHYIYVIGGMAAEYTDTIERYRTDLNIWQQIFPVYPTAAGWIGAVYVEKMPAN